jgi:hypothetical protein
MLTVAFHPPCSFYLCTLTVPKEDGDGSFSALERVLPTLRLDEPIPVSTVTEYPVIKPDIIITRSHDVDLHVMIETTDTHYIYTFHNNTSAGETVNHSLKRAFTAILRNNTSAGETVNHNLKRAFTAIQQYQDLNRRLEATFQRLDEENERYALRAQQTTDELDQQLRAQQRMDELLQLRAQQRVDELEQLHAEQSNLHHRFEQLERLNASAVEAPETDTHYVMEEVD